MSSKPDPTPSVKLRNALKLAAAGFHVFRCEAGGKRPLNTGWQQEATRDPDQIKAWFTEAPAINYGVALCDGQAVVDLDCKGSANGLDEFAAAALEVDDWDWAYLDDSPTFSVETPSGGRHLYMRAGFPVGNSSEGWPPGIDVRGQGGYVLGPGSYTDGRKGTAKGSYKALRDAVEVPEAPQWIADRFRHAGAKRDAANDDRPLFDLDTEAAVARAREFLSRRKPAIEGQGGDGHTYATFAHLRDIGVSMEMALELADGWNQRCEPPWLADELRVKAENAYRYARNQPGAKQAGADVFAEAAQSGSGEPADDHPQDVADMHAVAAYLESELDALPAWRWLIYDVLPAESVNLWHGQPDSFKSFTVLDLACHACMGWPWPSPPNRDDWSERACIKQYEPVRRMRVAYLATEGVSGLRKRVRAWKKHHGVTEDLDLVIVPDCPTFDTWSAVFNVMDKLREKLPEGVDWIIVDTLFGISGGLDVAQQADSSILFDRFKYLKVALGCAVTVIHHNKKGSDDEFGSRIWVANIDMQERLTGTIRGGGLKGVDIENMKTKDDRKRRTLSLTMHVVDLGVDDRQRAVSSLVPVADLALAQKANTDPVAAETRTDRALRLLQGRKRMQADWLAAQIVADENPGVQMTEGEKASKLESVRTWLRKHAKDQLAGAASKPGKAKTDPWQFSDPALVPRSQADRDD